ncbi:hypothetical protein [Actinocorallia longicatena]|uniref:Uncharacterized protein n=1 Tax=Actinocorallia longicatena TaxID=111803 RepID=A0ABP6QC90_9ACTN
MDAPEPRWTSLPAPIRLADTVATHPTLEHSEGLPDPQDLDKEWAVRWYG